MAKPTISKEVANKVRRALQERMDPGQTGLFPPHMDLVREASGLEFEPGDEVMYSRLLETVCGATDDSQPVEQYNGALGVPTSFVAAHQGPVGQLQWNDNLAAVFTNPGTVSGARWCSGTMISNDLFLTAGHCFDQTGGGWIRPLDNATGTTISPAQIATNMHVNFNFQVDPAGNLRAEQSFAITELLEYRLGNLDFAIVRLAGNPGAVWGVTQVAAADAAVGDMLCIIGHPAGWPKRIEAGPCLNLTGTQITYDDIDTLGGNSGSGILRAGNGQLVGVHTNGGCGPNSPGIGFNFGVRISSIIAQSSILQGITQSKPKALDDGIFTRPQDDVLNKSLIDNTTLKFRDDLSQTLKFLDDGGSIKVLDDGGTPSKAFDDVKAPAFDKNFSDQKLPGSDIGIGIGTVLPVEGGQTGATPFVLSTPHHSTAWTVQQAAGAAAQGASAAAQYEQALQQLESAIMTHIAGLSQLYTEYQRLRSEYTALAQRQMR